jgi:peroxidase
VLIGADKGQVRKQCRLVNGQEQQQQPQPQQQQRQQQLPWLRQRRPPRPFPRHPMGDLINGFFRGFH